MLMANNEHITDLTKIENLLTSIMSKEKKSRRINISNDKFGYLQDVKVVNKNKVTHIIFKTAREGFRTPLLDSIELEERENPKTINEGERNLTHIVLKNGNGGTFLFLETFQGSVGIKHLVNYLNRFFSKDKDTEKYKLSYEVLANKDFLVELRKFSRVTLTQLVYNKKILGSKYLGVANRYDEVRDNVVVELKPERTFSLKSLTSNIFKNVNDGDTEISNIRVSGENNFGANFTINSKKLIKKEHVSVRINIMTGEVNSTEILNKINEIAKEY